MTDVELVLQALEKANLQFPRNRISPQELLEKLTGATFDRTATPEPECPAKPQRSP